MNRIPFSVYDFFGYLASGFIIIVVIDYIIGVQWLLKEDLSVVLTLLWIVTAYIIGQINAGIASWLLERNVVGKWLGWPSINLFTDMSGKLQAKLFPGYFSALPETIRNAVLDKAKTEGIAEMGQSLFIHAFATVKRDENTMSRLDSFIKLYGFCRNMSIVLLFAFVVLIVGSFIEGDLHHLLLAIAAILGSIGMFYRYLKFLRQYSYELFISYLVLPSTIGKHGD